jgi:Arc/MetJ-type ribon-helix-helix transcriptional regulator
VCLRVPASLRVMAVHLAVCRFLTVGCSNPPMAWRAAQLLRAEDAGGMVIGMATRKVTITLDEAQLNQIRSLVQAGTAASVSGFVQHAVAGALDDVAGWGTVLAEALRATGGELSDKERAWADEVLGTGTQPAA